MKEKYYEIKPCDLTDFSSEYEKKFFSKNKDKKYQCIPSKEIYLEGTQDSQYEKKDHAYFVYEIIKCNTSNALDG